MKRNAFAVAAFMRRAGAHGGPRKPDYDETEEGLEEYEEEKYDDQERRIPVRPGQET